MPTQWIVLLLIAGVESRGLTRFPSPLSGDAPLSKLTPPSVSSRQLAEAAALEADLDSHLPALSSSDQQLEKRDKRDRRFVFTTLAIISLIALGTVLAAAIVVAAVATWRYWEDSTMVEKMEARKEEMCKRFDDNKKQIKFFQGLQGELDFGDDLIGAGACEAHTTTLAQHTKVSLRTMKGKWASVLQKAVELGTAGVVEADLILHTEAFIINQVTDITLEHYVEPPRSRFASWNENLGRMAELVEVAAEVVPIEEVHKFLEKIAKPVQVVSTVVNVGKALFAIQDMVGFIFQAYDQMKVSKLAAHDGYKDLMYQDCQAKGEFVASLYSSIKRLQNNDMFTAPLMVSQADCIIAATQAGFTSPETLCPEGQMDVFAHIKQIFLLQGFDLLVSCNVFKKTVKSKGLWDLMMNPHQLSCVSEMMLDLSPTARPPSSTDWAEKVTTKLPPLRYGDEKEKTGPVFEARAPQLPFDSSKYSLKTGTEGRKKLIWRYGGHTPLNSCPALGTSDHHVELLLNKANTAIEEEYSYIRYQPGFLARGQAQDTAEEESATEKGEGICVTDFGMAGTGSGYAKVQDFISWEFKSLLWAGDLAPSFAEQQPKEGAGFGLEAANILDTFKPLNCPSNTFSSDPVLNPVYRRSAWGSPIRGIESTDDEATKLVWRPFRKGETAESLGRSEHNAAYGFSNGLKEIAADWQFNDFSMAANLWAHAWHETSKDESGEYPEDSWAAKLWSYTTYTNAVNKGCERGCDKKQYLMYYKAGGEVALDDPLVKFLSYHLCVHLKCYDELDASGKPKCTVPDELVEQYCHETDETKSKNTIFSKDRTTWKQDAEKLFNWGCEKAQVWGSVPGIKESSLTEKNSAFKQAVADVRRRKEAKAAAEAEQSSSRATDDARFSVRPSLETPSKEKPSKEKPSKGATKTETWTGHQDSGMCCDCIAKELRWLNYPASVFGYLDMRTKTPETDAVELRCGSDCKIKQGRKTKEAVKACFKQPSNTLYWELRSKEDPWQPRFLDHRSNSDDHSPPPNSQQPKQQPKAVKPKQAEESREPDVNIEDACKQCLKDEKKKVKPDKHSIEPSKKDYEKAIFMCKATKVCIDPKANPDIQHATSAKVNVEYMKLLQV